MSDILGLSLSSVIVRSDQQVTGILDHESVVLSTRTWKYYAFNALGDQIWDSLESPQQISQICDKIVLRHEVDRQRCEQDVLNFIEALVKDGLARIAE